MRFYLSLLSVAWAASDVGISPHGVIQQAQREEISFIEDTLKSMEHNKEAVLKSNNDLDQLVNEDGARLAQLTGDVDELNQHALRTLQSSPASFLQMKSLDDYGDDIDGDAPLIARRPAGPQSILEMLRGRSSASLRRFENAMKKLQEDKSKLLKDEDMRRARATEERRHIRL